MKKLIIITMILTGYSLSSLANNLSKIPDIPDFDFCSIKCLSEDSEGNEYKGVHMQYSRVGNVKCLVEKATIFSLANCKKHSDDPESCVFITDSCK